MKTKLCHICQAEQSLMFRVKLDTSKCWYFLCKKCTEINKSINTNYVYGGTWKG
jgi:hypothetical protein